MSQSHRQQSLAQALRRPTTWAHLVTLAQSLLHDQRALSLVVNHTLLIVVDRNVFLTVLHHIPTDPASLSPLPAHTSLRWVIDTFAPGEAMATLHGIAHLVRHGYTFNEAEHAWLERAVAA